MGLLDISADQGENLMSMGLGLLSASGPSRQPVSLGQALAAGYQQMQQNQQLQRHNKREDMQMQMMQDRFGMEKEYKTLQEQQMRAGMAQQEQENRLRAGLLGALGGQFGSQQQAQPVPLPQLGEAQGTGQYRLDVSTPEAKANLSRQLDYLSKNDPETHKQVLAALVKQGAIDQPMQQVQQPQQNWGNIAQLSAMGQLMGVKGAGGMMDLAKFNRPDWQQIDSGGQIQFVNKNDGQMPVIQKSMSPDAMASNQLSRDRLEFDQNPALQGRIAQEKEVGKALGEVQVKRQTDLPNAVSRGEEAIRLSNELLSHKGLNQAVGSSSMMGVQKIPGTQAYDFMNRLEQIKGGAFLQAFESLKGGGQITEIEGNKATSAIARMDNATTEEGFRAAVRDYQQVISSAIDRAKSGFGESSSGPKSTMSSGGWSATLVK